VRRLATPFGAATLALLVLAGWAAWTAGIFDGPLARDVRTSSVYAAPGIELDRAAAERVIGNRRLVLAFLDRDADLEEACDDTSDAAAGTLVILFKPAADEFEHYGCAQFPDDDYDGENFGKAFAAETVAPQGADQFLHRPLEAVKVVALNYDTLVKAGTVPDGARTIEPSAPRYLLAAVAVLAVIGGAVTVFLAGRRIGRLAARHQATSEAEADARAARGVKAAALARQIIDLDRRAAKNDDYRQLAADYARLAADLTADDPDSDLDERLERLSERARELTRADAPAGSRRRSKRAPSR
jgi:hypothetical protein